MKKKYILPIIGLAVLILAILFVIWQDYKSDTSDKKTAEETEESSEIITSIKTSDFNYDKELYPYGLPVDENGNELTDPQEIMTFNEAHGATGTFADDEFIGKTVEEQAKIDTFDMNYTGSMMSNLNALYEDMENAEAPFDPWSFDPTLFAEAVTQYIDESTNTTDPGYCETRYNLTYKIGSFHGDQNFPWFIFEVDELGGVRYRCYYNVISKGYIIKDSGKYDYY